MKSFILELVMFPKNSRATPLKKSILKIQPCQRHQLEHLMLNTRGHNIRKTFIILMGTGSLSMG